MFNITEMEKSFGIVRIFKDGWYIGTERKEVIMNETNSMISLKEKIENNIITG